MSSLSIGRRTSNESPSRFGGPGLGLLLLATTSLLGAAVFVSHRIRSTDLLRWSAGMDWWELPLPSTSLTTAAAGLVALPLVAIAVRGLRSLALPAAAPAAIVLLLAQGPLPSPFDVPRTLPRLLANPYSRSTALSATAEAAAVAVFLLAVGAALLRSTHRGQGLAEIAHGTARLATPADLRAADLLSGEGVVLGSRPSLFGAQPVTDRSADHVLVVMPPGGGKTTGPIAGSLLNLDSSAVVLDPKGELWNLTAGWRRDAGHRLVRFAPHQGRATCRWNPLGEIRRGDGEVGLVSALAENLITYPAAMHGENHWTVSARSLLRCLVLHALYTWAAPSFGDVRDLLMSEANHAKLFRKLAEADHTRQGGDHGWKNASEGTRTHPEVARLARSFAATPARERGSIVSTLSRFLDLWGDPLVREATEHSNWTLAMLTDSAKPVTIYVTVPTNELARIAPLLRVLITLLTYRITAQGDGFRDREAFPDRLPIYLILDEFAGLGRMPLLENVMAFLRGYGVRCVLAVQDLSQLRRLYGPDHTISANCRLHVAAASADVATRQEISRRLGEATHTYRKRSRSGRLLSARTTVSQAEVRRPLLTEGEVGTLPGDRLLIVKAGHPPVLASKLPYWEHPELLARAGRPLREPQAKLLSLHPPRKSIET